MFILDHIRSSPTTAKLLVFILLLYLRSDSSSTAAENPDMIILDHIRSSAAAIELLDLIASNSSIVGVEDPNTLILFLDNPIALQFLFLEL